mmetsp:Transcript_177803/g.570177  ORF Transcript_177803/g.570177 Transcript_177803/m.570177 type:complete len:266 (-) Transcript_177803:1179-1976(-)
MPILRRKDGDLRRRRLSERRMPILRRKDGDLRGNRSCVAHQAMVRLNNGARGQQRQRRNTLWRDGADDERHPAEALQQTQVVRVRRQVSHALLVEHLEPRLLGEREAEPHAHAGGIDHEGLLAFLEQNLELELVCQFDERLRLGISENELLRKAAVDVLQKLAEDICPDLKEPDHIQGLAVLTAAEPRDHGCEPLQHSAMCKDLPALDAERDVGRARVLEQVELVTVPEQRCTWRRIGVGHLKRLQDCIGVDAEKFVPGAPLQPK